MATKYQNYITGDDGNRAFYQTVAWQAQTFTPSINHIISSVKLKLYRYTGSVPGILTACIYATSAGKPTGSVLASGTCPAVTANAITTTSPGEWVEITITGGYLLLASTVYALVMKSSTDDPTKPIYWRRDGSSPTYTGGSGAITDDEGVSWTLYTDEDCMFEEWGDPEGSGGGGAIYPSDPVARVTSIIHRYDRGVYNMELGLGDVISDFGIPGVDSFTRKSYEPKVSYPEMVEQTGLTAQQIAKLGRESADIRMGRIKYPTTAEAMARLREISEILRGLRSYG